MAISSTRHTECVRQRRVWVFSRTDLHPALYWTEIFFMRVQSLDEVPCRENRRRSHASHEERMRRRALQKPNILWRPTHRRPRIQRADAAASTSFSGPCMVFSHEGVVPALECRGLSKTYGAGRVVLENLDFPLAPGEFVAILGDSGVGKSTLLNLIAGLDQADC